MTQTDDIFKVKEKFVSNLSDNNSQKQRILCVEDHEDTCELIAFVLSDYEVIFSKTVENSIKVFNAQTFDLCILDYWLKDGNGIDLCQQILALKPTTPIIFASGIGQRTEVQKALNAGARDFLVKPYSIDVLVQIVKEQLSLSK